MLAAMGKKKVIIFLFLPRSGHSIKISARKYTRSDPLLFIFCGCPTLLTLPPLYWE